MKIKGTTLLLVFLNLAIGLHSQQVLYHKDIALTIQNKCFPCHAPGGVGPFALSTYDEVKHHAKMIEYVIEEHLMPPWRADITYTHFYKERKLDSGFIEIFKKWGEGGFLPGSEKSIGSVNPAISKLEKPDYIIKMPKPYKLEGTNTDVFISFLDSIFPGEGRYIKGITIIPGNTKVVHHCRVDMDTSDRYAKFLDKDGFINTSELNTLGPPAYAFLGDYVPGISPYSYPDNIGYKLTKKLYVLVNIHYAPGSRVEYDSTKIYIYLYPKGDTPRAVRHWATRAGASNTGVDISVIPKDSLATYAISSLPIDTTLSLISIQPHMHLLGKSMQVFAVTPARDTIRLIRINDWRFKWQENYYFSKAVKLPKGTVLLAIGVFDNTSGNPENPFFPPQDIYFNDRMRTTNEMFEFYLQTVIYQPGDENLNLYK